MHSLNVEIGRHINVGYNQRLCIISDTREVKDEFCYEMPMYNSLRHIHSTYINVNQCTVDESYSTFNGSRNVVLALSKIICYAYRLTEERVKKLN